LIGVVLAAVYLLWAYQQVFHGRREGDERPEQPERPFAELTVREGLVLAPLLGLIVFLGVYPKPILDRITPSVDGLVAHVAAATRTPTPPLGKPVLSDQLIRLPGSALEPFVVRHGAVRVTVSAAGHGPNHADGIARTPGQEELHR
jgi:hypothetical protein